MNLSYSITSYPTLAGTSLALKARPSVRQVPPPAPAELTDTELLLQIIAQSEVALAQFYRRFGNVIMAFAMSHLASEQDCREIVNDVLLTVWSSAGRFAGRSSVRTWVLGITHHKTMDCLRKRQRQRQNRNQDDYLHEPATADNILEQAVAAQDTTMQIHQCLTKLSAAQRDVIHLAFFADLTCSEIAEVVDCPIGTVKTRLMHAKEKLKQLLQESGWTDGLF